MFLELSSFGAFADFYLFCANRWGDSGMRDEHYMLRRANSLRNAAVHSSAIVNGFGSPLSAPQLRYPAPLAAALGEIGMSKRLRRSKMRNPRILQMAVLAYAYPRFVPREKAEGTPERLLALADRSKLHGDWYASNTVITSSHDFIARVFEAWLEDPLSSSTGITVHDQCVCTQIPAGSRRYVLGAQPRHPRVRALSPSRG